MKRSRKYILPAILAVLSLATVAFAQMGMSMSEKNNQMMGNMNPDSTNAVMMKMSKNHMMMNRDLMQMQEHMKSMMDMNDMKALHAEMQKQMEMMQGMQKTMSEQGKMYRMMMGPEGMGNMKAMPRKTMMEESKSESTKKEKKY